MNLEAAILARNTKKPKIVFYEKRESAYSLRHPPLSPHATPAETWKTSYRVNNANPETLKRTPCSAPDLLVVWLLGCSVG